jgi:hypothetical protein
MLPTPVEFLEHVHHRLERIEAGRDAAIDAGLQQDFLDLVTCDAVGQRALHMQLQLGGAVEGGEHREVQHRACFARQAGARPDLAPGVFGGHLLEAGEEIVGAGQGAVDILGAQHGSPHLQALLEQVALVFRTFGHDGTP